MNKTFLPILALALLFVATPGSARAAEGDPVWSINPIPLFGGIYLCFTPTFYTDVVNTNNVVVGTCTDIFAANNSTVVGLNSLTGATTWNVTPPLTISAFAVDTTGFYIGGGIPWSGAYREVLQKRSLVDGSLIWSKSGPNCNAASCPGRYYNMISSDGSGNVYAMYPSGAGSLGDPGGKLYKLNASNGNEIWSMRSALYDAYFHNLVVDTGGIYIGGSYNHTGYLYTGDPRDSFYQKLDPATGASVWLKNEVFSTSRDVWSLGLVGGDLYATIINWVGSTTFATETRKVNVATGNTLNSFADNNFFVTGDANGIYSGIFHDFFTSVPPIYKKRDRGDLSVVWSAPVQAHYQAQMTDGSSKWRFVHRATDFYGLTGSTMERRSLADGSLLWSKPISGNSYNVNYLTYDGTYLYGLFTDPSWNVVYSKMNASPVYCGPANGVPAATAPTPTPATPPNNLCTSGSAPTVTATGTSFAWTCDGLDGLPSTPDDAACSAPRAATLSLCTAGGIPIASTAGPHSRSLVIGTSEVLNAFYDTTPYICGDTSPVTNATWSDDPLSTVVSIAGATASPQAVTAGTSGTERVAISRGVETILLDYTVSASCTPTTTCGEQSRNYCQGQPFTIPDNGCGFSLECTGTRFCDFNWKEVAPGN